MAHMRFWVAVHVLSFVLSHGAEKPVMRHASSLQMHAEVESSGVITDIAEKDPETQQADFNHHFLLLQTSAKTPVDALLVAEKAFNTSQLKQLCNASSHLECLTHLKIAVVRGKRKHLNAALHDAKLADDLKFVTMTEYMPKFITYLQRHLFLGDVGKALASYSKEGVILPAENIAEEFRKQGKELINEKLINWTRQSEFSLIEEANDEDQDDEHEEEDEELPEPDEESYSHFLLHQTDASSPVKGVLFMKNGHSFNSLDVAKVCSTYKKELECIKDLPISVVRAPTESMTKIIVDNPAIEYMNMQTDATRIVNFLKGSIGEESVRELLGIYTQSGVTIPQEVTREFDLKSGLLDISDDDTLEDASDEDDD